MSDVSAIRTAVPSDLPAIGRGLAQSFHDDPVLAHLLPNGRADRMARLASFMQLGATGALASGTVLTTSDHAATAVWRSPGRWKLTGREMIRTLPATLRALRGRTRVAKRALDAIEAVHPEEPHWYLEILGTVPERQGHGLAAAAMAPILARCDEEGIPAYLESSKHSNIAYYQRHGFRVTSELSLPDGGPSVWPMWRDPR